MAAGCKWILMISCLDSSVLLWIFDLVCSVWHGRGVTSKSVDPDFDRQWYMPQLEMVDRTWPNSQFSDPKSSEILRSNSCDLARPVASPAASSRPRQRAAAPGGKKKGHLEVVEVLLAAGAWVEAKNDNGCGPQRRDGRDRTDVVWRRCHGFQD